MRRIRPWVKKALLVSIIIVAVGAGLSLADGEHGRDITKVVRVSQEFHGKPAGDMKVEIRGGEGVSVPALRGDDASVPVPPSAPFLKEGGNMRFGRDHEHEHGFGVAVGGAILIAGLLIFWLSKRSKRSRRADSVNVLAGIPSASDFLDQWEMQQNQSKESK
ncbi:hypothetical protein [Paenibacillus sp. OV219]|uniref:hypothetical protein n=1 Tax=Paenibacillus sp. OV219 TaxID=1884377 RepID=UPI0008B3870A|nr:hypothetical protein [Paenibacillus sp. OV219]SEN51589.1 hypothetical protein SAMN05518847_103112 [Paenibacillus sp. OV219]